MTIVARQTATADTGAVIHSKERSQRGQSLVEFALTLPIFLLLVLGTVDLGRAVYIHTALSNAVRDGCRVAIVAGNSSGQVIQTVVQSAVGVNLPAANVTVSGARTPGTTVTVSAFVTFHPVTPMIQRFFAGPITLRAVSAMVVD